MPDNDLQLPPAADDDQQWHDARYGDKRVKLTGDQLRRFASDIANGDHDTACKLILLMDEIERAQFDRADLQNITITVRDEAMRYTSNHSDAHDALIEAMRSEIATTGQVLTRRSIEGH